MNTIPTAGHGPSEAAQSGLMSGSKPRAFRLAAIFLTGVLLLDQALLIGGNALVRSGHWSDGLLPSLAEAKDQDVYILGGCRAAVNFDSRLIGEKTGKRVFNAAVVADGLGNIDFALAVLQSHKKQGTAVFVIDDGNWEEADSVVRPEIERRLIWWYLLNEQGRKEIASAYPLPMLSFRSGFIRFVGKGRDLAKAAIRTALGRTVNRDEDGYAPRAAEQNIIPNLARESELTEGIRTTFRPSKFASDRIEGFLRRAVAGGLRPVLVIAPMHRYRATDEVNRLQEEKVKALAAKYQAGYISYLGNQGALAGNDTLWSDVGHMNRLGAEALSRAFAEDLVGITEVRP